MSTDLYTVRTLRSGPPAHAPVIVTSPLSAPMIVLLPIEDREVAIRDLAVAYRAAGARAFTMAGAVMLSVMGGGRGGDPAALIGRWAEVLGCEVIDFPKAP